MGAPVQTFRMSLGSRYSVAVCLWEESASAPVRHKFAFEGYFDPLCKHSAKIGTIHLGRDYLSYGTITHEAYHAIVELERRIRPVETRRGVRWSDDDKEEWCAQRIEALATGIAKRLAKNGESISL